MVNIFHVVSDGLATGSEAAKDFEAEQAGKNPDFKPLADDLLRFAGDFKINEPWVTDEMLAEGLKLLGDFLEQKRPAA